jgi:hypothetical protein
VTAQIFERILYEGEQRFMADEPLEAWFEQKGRPAFRAINTALWRCYVGTWEIRDGRLFLLHIAANYEDGTPVTLADLFPEHRDDAPVAATWFTGRLRLPRGERLRYVHMGYESLYEEDLFLDVDQGVVVGAKLQRNSSR